MGETTDWAGNELAVGVQVWAIHGGTGDRDLATIESIVGDVLWIRYRDGHAIGKRSFEVTRANTAAARAPGRGGGG